VLIIIKLSILILWFQGPFGSRLMCSYLIYGKAMAIEAAHALHLGPQECSAHGTWLVARNGSNGMSDKNENWLRALINNALRTCVGCSTMYFRQAYEVCHICAAIFIFILTTNTMQGIGRKIGDNLDHAIAQSSAARYASPQTFTRTHAHTPTLI
jgi:hypothetical protein